MNYCFKTIFIALVFCLVGCRDDANAQDVLVRKTAERGNPSLSFRGVQGNPALSAALAKAFKRCGWFNMVAGSKADLVVAAKAAGNVIVNVNGQQRFAFQVRNSETVQKTAGVIVDYVLKKVFGINGICSSKIAFCIEPKKGYKEICTINFDGSGFQRKTRNNNLSVEPEWSPDSNQLYYTLYNHGDTDIVKYDMKSRRSQRIVQFPGLNSGPAISPDKKYMAFLSSKDKMVDLYVKRLGTKSVRRLTKNRFPEASPCWSPDGRKLCFAAGYYGNPKLFIISATGGNPKSVPTIGVEAVSPDWSKNNQIVYSARMGKNYTIGLTDMNGQFAPKCLVRLAGDWESPSWAPDNRHVICSRTLNGKSSLYIIDTITGKVRPFIKTKDNLSMPCWSGITR